MDDDGVTRTTRFDEWPDDGIDLLLRLKGWFGDNAWLIAEVPMYDNTTQPNATRSYVTPVGGPVETERSRIRDGMSMLEQQAGELHEAIAYLEKRLDTVLVPTGPTVSSAGIDVARPGLPPSHLLGRFSILNEQLTSAAHKLREIINRIDV